MVLLVACFHATFLLGLLFDPEEEDIFFQHGLYGDNITITILDIIHRLVSGDRD
jgi:hypothetical protein